MIKYISIFVGGFLFLSAAGYRYKLLVGCSEDAYAKEGKFI